MRDTVLVIGATGNVGHHLVNLLVGRGQTVKAATRNPDHYNHASATPVYFDYDETSSFDIALEGANRVFFFAKNADTQPEKTLIPFINRAVEKGVSQMVLMTAFGVDQAEGIGLREVEKYLIAADVHHTILRPGWFMENFNPGFILPMIQQGTIYLPAADAKVAFITARDIAKVAAIALTEEQHLDQEYPLTGGEALSYAEAAEILSNVTGRDVNYVAVPDEALHKSLTEAGWYPEQVSRMVGLFQNVQQGYSSYVVPTIRQLTGHDPLSFQAFAEKNKDAWMIDDDRVS